MEVLGEFIVFRDRGCMEEIEMKRKVIVRGIDRMGGSRGNVCENIRVLWYKGIDNRGVWGIGRW